MGTTDGVNGDGECYINHPNITVWFDGPDTLVRNAYGGRVLFNIQGGSNNFKIIGSSDTTQMPVITWGNFAAATGNNLFFYAPSGTGNTTIYGIKFRKPLICPVTNTFFSEWSSSSDTKPITIRKCIILDSMRTVLPVDNSSATTVRGYITIDSCYMEGGLGVSSHSVITNNVINPLSAEIDFYGDSGIVRNNAINGYHVSGQVISWDNNKNPYGRHWVFSHNIYSPIQHDIIIDGVRDSSYLDSNILFGTAGMSACLYNHGNGLNDSSYAIRIANNYMFDTTGAASIVFAYVSNHSDSILVYRNYFQGQGSFTINAAITRFTVQQSIFTNQTPSLTNCVVRSDTLHLVTPRTNFDDTLPRYAWPKQYSGNRAIISTSPASCIGPHGFLTTEISNTIISGTSYSVVDSLNNDYRWFDTVNSNRANLFFVGDTASPRLVDSVAGGTWVLKTTSTQIHAGNRTTLTQTGLTSGVKHYFKIIILMSNGGMDTSFTDSVTLPSSVTYDTCYARAATGGTISPASVADSSNNVNHNLGFAATPNTHYTFLNWSDVNGFATIGSQTSTTTVTISQNDTIQSNFRLLTKTLTMAGTQALSTVPAIGTNPEDSNTTVSISQVANPGYRFWKWTRTVTAPVSLFGDSTQSSTTVTIMGNITVTAVDTIIHYQFTNANDGHGSFIPVSGLKDTAALFTITATPTQGYRFWKWNRSSTNVIITDSTLLSTTASLKAPATITLYDTTMKVNLTMVNAAPVGTLSPVAGTITLDSGTSQAITFTAPTGYAFWKWARSSTSAIISDSTQASTSAIIIANVTITAYDTIIPSTAHYVSNVGTGSWAASKSISTPCSTQVAFDSAKAGDIVYFRGGVYTVPQNNNINNVDYTATYQIAHAGTSIFPIIFMAYPTEIPIMNGAIGGSGDVTAEGSFFATIFGSNDKSWIVFDGFIFEANSGIDMARVFLGIDHNDYDGNGNLTIKNCTFNGGISILGSTVTDNEEGLRIEGAHNVLVHGCKFFNYNQINNYHNTSAIKTYHDTTLTVENCEFFNNALAIFYKSQTPKCTSRYNYIHDNFQGILITPDINPSMNTDSVYIYNNLINNNSSSAFLQTGSGSDSGTHGDDYLIFNNTFYNNGTRPVTIGYTDPGGHGVQFYNNIILGGTPQYAFVTDDLYNFSAPAHMVWRNYLQAVDHNQWGTPWKTLRIGDNGRNINYTSLVSWQASGQLENPFDAGCGASINPGCGDLSSNPNFTNTTGTYSIVADFRVASGSCLTGSRTAGLMGANMDSLPIDTSLTIINHSVDSGTTSGGTIDTVYGNNFLSTQTSGTITYGSSIASISNWNNVRIILTTPAHSAGVVDIVITNSLGQTSTLSGAFKYIIVGPGPAISSIIPDSTNAAAPGKVAINGTNFSASSTVKIGSTGYTGATSASMNSISTTIDTITPPVLARGLYKLYLTDNAANVDSIQTFYYYSVPVISNHKHTTGGTAGGTADTINGSGFIGLSGLTVTYGSNSASIVSVTDTKIALTTPSGVRTGSAVNIVVTNTDGKSVTLTSAYTYLASPPTISYVSNPWSFKKLASVTDVATLSGTTCTGVTATGLPSNIICNISTGTLSGIASSTQVQTSASITAAGQDSNTIVTLPITVTAATQFTLTVNTVGNGSTTPSTGSVDSSASITVTNTPSNGSAFKIWSITANGTLSSSTTVNPNIVTLAGNATLTATDTVVPASLPSISSIVSDSTSSAAPSKVAINGTNFTSTSTVKIGSTGYSGATLATIRSMSATIDTITPPTLSRGLYTVYLTNNFSNVDSTKSFYYYTPVTITNHKHTTGGTVGGTKDTINGSGFISSSGLTVTYGGSFAVIVSSSNTQIALTTPAGSRTGSPVNIVVTNTDGRSATISNGFTYLASPPTISYTSNPWSIICYANVSNTATIGGVCTGVITSSLPSGLSCNGTTGLLSGSAKVYPESVTVSVTAEGQDSITILPVTIYMTSTDSVLIGKDTVKAGTLTFSSGYTLTKPSMCNYAHFTTTNLLSLSSSITARDTLVCEPTANVTSTAGSRIYTTPGYTLIVKLNGVRGLPSIVNRSKIKWE
jgi:hypothetical protein